MLREIRSWLLKSVNWFKVLEKPPLALLFLLNYDKVNYMIKFLVYEKYLLL